MPRLKNRFSWSKSRDGLFSKCLRAYYYHYYGSWNGWRRDAPLDVRELYVMKNLQTIPMWMGQLVHAVAEEVMRGIGRAEQLPIDRAVQVAEERARSDFEDSRSGLYRSKPNRLCGLQEHYYGIPLTDDSLEEALATVEGCIRRLYGTPTYERTLELGPESIIEFESLQSMALSGYKVWVKPDLVVRGLDDEVLVVDWKTGLSSGRKETELQLAIYGLYAVEVYDFSLEDLSGLEVNLRSGEEHFYPLDAHALAHALRYIQNSARGMQELLHNPAENIALIKDFPKTADLHSCHECRFRRACDRN